MARRREPSDRRFLHIWTGMTARADTGRLQRPFQRPGGEIPERRRPVLSRVLEHEAEDHFRGKRHDEQHQVSSEWIIAHVAGHILWHAVALTPDHLAVVCVETHM